MRAHRYSDRFSAVRVETTGRLPDAVHKSSSVDALLVSLSLRPVAASNYRLWVDSKVVPTGRIPAFRANLIDLGARPAMWADRGIHYVHFHLRRSCIDDTAAELGYDRVWFGEVRGPEAMLAFIARRSRRQEAELAEVDRARQAMRLSADRTGSNIRTFATGEDASYARIAQFLQERRRTRKEKVQNEKAKEKEAKSKPPSKKPWWTLGLPLPLQKAG